jgi:hypothetical protein
MAMLCCAHQVKQSQLSLRDWQPRPVEECITAVLRKLIEVRNVKRSLKETQILLLLKQASVHKHFSRSGVADTMLSML